MALVILLAIPFVVPASRAHSGVRLDVSGAAAVSIGLLAFTFGITDQISMR